LLVLTLTHLGTDEYGRFGSIYHLCWQALSLLPTDFVDAWYKIVIQIDEQTSARIGLSYFMIEQYKQYSSTMYKPVLSNMMAEY
ncbi:16873_t:CDS:2, partial [Gigaspora margarita]